MIHMSSAAHLHYRHTLGMDAAQIRIFKQINLAMHQTTQLNLSAAATTIIKQTDKKQTSANKQGGNHTTMRPR